VIPIPLNSAASAILADGETGRVLYEKNPHDKRLIASITKLMTALVAVELEPDLEQKVEVRREWTLTEGSSMYLREGECLSLETLLYGLLLSSGNDAALAVAGACAGEVESFVEQMNRRAASLGMENTHFTNPSGLNDEEHYSTAYDMALLARECLKQPKLREIMSTRTAVREGHSFANHNKLLWRYEGCIGMKTGYTQKAGRTLISAAQRNGQTLICVTLSDPNDWEDHAALLDYGFAVWPRRMLVQAGQRLGAVQVDGSLVRQVGVAAGCDVYYPLAPEEEVRILVNLPEKIKAPIEKGSAAGSVSFWLGEEEIGRADLLFDASVRDDCSKSGFALTRLLNMIREKDTAAALPRT